MWFSSIFNKAKNFLEEKAQPFATSLYNTLKDAIPIIQKYSKAIATTNVPLISNVAEAVANVADTTVELLKGTENPIDAVVNTLDYTSKRIKRKTKN